MNTICIHELADQANVKFGTSGVRGLVSDLDNSVCFAYTCAFLKGICIGSDKVAIGHDLRPSSPRITQACIQAIHSFGLAVEYVGALPTPALAHYCMCMATHIPGIMVTGSHIPFDRNGIKFYRANGEISKQDEARILGANISLPDTHQPDPLPPQLPLAIDGYLKRYIDFFGQHFLSGKTVAIYQHSSVARDILASLFTAMGANIIALGRSDAFVPIDTEAVRQEDIDQAKAWALEHDFDMLVSTDGDGDRALIADEKGQWLRGDIIGVLCAKFLEAEQVVTPVSSNTVVELSGNFTSVHRTKIGSPFVLETMASLARDCPGCSIVGYEANGGVLLGTKIKQNSAILMPLPTRDAVLPMLAILGLAMDLAVPVSQLTSRLPPRFTHSDRIQGFAPEKSRFLLESLAQNRSQITHLLAPNSGEIIKINQMDGLRASFSNGDIVHIRPSGNAPELRCYAEASTPEQAKDLVGACLSRVKQANG